MKHLIKLKCHELGYPLRPLHLVGTVNIIRQSCKGIDCLVIIGSVTFAETFAAKGPLNSCLMTRRLMTLSALPEKPRNLPDRMWMWPSHLLGHLP